MKKLIAKLSMFALLATSMVFPFSGTAAVPNWDATGSYVVSFEYSSSFYAHDMTLSQDGSGNLTGSGGYPAGGPHTFTWVIDSGSVSGDTISFTAHYTAPADAVTPLTVMNVTGTITAGGDMSGTWTDNYQGGSRAGTWSLVSGNATALSDTTVVVESADLTLSPGGWYFYDDVANTANASEVPGDYEMVAGPGTPPAGDGSVQMTVSGTERWNIATYQYAGTDLADISALEFSTYQPSSNPGSDQRAIYLNFDVDFDNTITTGYQGRLVYVPNVNGTVSEDTWQDWDAIDGGTGMWLYSGAMWPGTTDAGTTTKTWTQILALYPNAEVFNESFTGQLLFRAGEPYADGFTGNVDNIVIGINGDTTTYDFEPVAAGGDEQAPIVTSVMVDPNPSLEGDSVTVTANIDDTTTGGSNIASAEYSIDGGTWTPMTAEDGTFDEMAEDVTASVINTTPGNHEICVRGTDAAGNVATPVCYEYAVGDTVVSGGGNIADGKGKKLWTFGSEINMLPDDTAFGHITVTNHAAKVTCNFTTITNLVITGNTATFTGEGKCNDGVTRTANFTIVDNGEPGTADKITITGTAPMSLAQKTITGGNFQVHEAEFPEAEESTFSATNSNYYNGVDDTTGLYASGPISFSWDPTTGVVSGGQYDEMAPAVAGTVYYNVVQSGTVSSTGAVSLTFIRTNPNNYGPFTFTGQLTGNTLTGTLDGPYYFTATGIVTP